jgi:two-component system chemotaxis sensor kinase CheA
MIERRQKVRKHIKVANALAIVLVFFLGGVFIVETYIDGSIQDYTTTILLILAALVLLISVIRTTYYMYKLASNVPIILFLFYIALMALGKWGYSSHLLLVSIAFCGISCIYSNFQRTLFFVILQNIFIALLLLIWDTPISGPDTHIFITLINWGISIFACIILLILSRYATVVLNRARQHQNSFNNLLATTENYVAMIDESNKVVYASKTFADLGNVEQATLVQGRPIIDLFPGRSLKSYAGKMLKEKDNYAEDWEFTLNGQKRYFKAASHSLLGRTGGSLISLYDMTHLAERDEIAAMKDSMKIGLFFMDQNCIIQDHYSRYLEEMLVEKDLFGKLFTDIIAASVTSNDLESIKDYFEMVRERSYDQEMLDEINPLNELHYTNARTGDKKVLQFIFSTVERGHGEVFLLVTVYDVTISVELRQRLAEEEAKRQEEMQAVFELIQVEPDVFSDFMADMESEFNTIDKVLKDEEYSAHEALVKVYQSVHAIKSNAVILGLNVFGNKVHTLEANIKRLREWEDGPVPFNEMLNLTMEIEKISNEREGFKEVIDKLQNYAGGGSSGTGERQNVKVMVESLAKAVNRASEDMEKKTKFIATDIDREAIDKGPRRMMKDILMQLIRNSVVHGIEKPDIRKGKGKNETGIVKLTINVTEDHKHIHIKLIDDGKGLDYPKISQKALSKNLIKKEDANNKDALLKAIFLPGFSTAEGAEDGVHAGRGIGLNLVRDRVKEVNGSIKVKSETDKGTMFFVSIPLHSG